MKKVRVTVSDFMFEILKGDTEYLKYHQVKQEILYLSTLQTKI